MLDGTDRQTNNSTREGGTQADSAAERLFHLFVGNERRHVKGSGPAVWDKEKNKWSLSVTTYEGPATVDHWQQHLDQKYILSIIPLLDDGKCLFACLDVDDYEISYIDICDCIARLKLPLLPCVSKSTGLHVFVFLKEPIPAKLLRPALQIWASLLGLKKFEIFPTNDGTSGDFSRAIAMPYGATWTVLPEQHALNAIGNALLLDSFLFTVKKITADDLPEPQKELQRQSRQIPLYLQGAINAFVPEKDRSNYCWSILLHLVSLGFDKIQICDAVRGKGAFVRYDEKSRSLEQDVDRALAQNPNKKTKVEICTDIMPWDPSPPPPVEWSIAELTAAGSITSAVGDSGAGKSFLLWNMAVSRMYGEPFAHRKVSQRCGVMMWLAEGAGDYRQRCRAAVKAAGHDPNERLPLLMANQSMLPLTADQSEEQLHGMIDNANAWLQENFGLSLGCIFIDTFAMASLFEDSYKPNEIIEVNRKLLRVAGSRKIDTVYTDHFPKKDKAHPAGTLNKRNDVDQMLRLEANRMILDKSRYGPDKMWNAYHMVRLDDGAGYLTQAVKFGPTQYPNQYEIDNAGIFMEALLSVQQAFGLRIKESELQKLFIELHIAAQQSKNVKSENPKEQARSAFRRELKSAVEGGIVQANNGFVWEVENG